MTSWKDWYFERAKQRVTPEASDLFWKDIKPGCSNKMLAQVAKGVLDIGDPTSVDWRFIRPTHVWLRQDNLDKRTLLAAMSNIKRIASKGAQRRISSWFNDQMGWHQTQNKLTELALISEEDYQLIEAGAVDGLPADLATGIRALLRLMYYGGLTYHRAGTIKSEDMVFVDGRLLIYVSGALLEIPDHVRLPLMSWIRLRSEMKLKGRKAKTDGTARIFRADQYRVAAQFPKLSETYRSIKRLRG